MKQEIKYIQGARYAVTKDIFPPKYSIIRLIGKTGYEHMQSFRRKQDALNTLNDNDITPTQYKHNRP